MDIELKALWTCVIIAWACIGWIKLRSDSDNVSAVEKGIVVSIACLSTVAAVASLLVKIWQ